MKTLHVVARDEWRRWLQANAAREKEIWLIFHKRHTGKPRLEYDDAVEEALCFGWIDSIIRRLDDERYAQKFTPRRDREKWSALNVGRAKRLIAAGLMTPAGLAVMAPGVLRRPPAAAAAKAPAPVPDYFMAALENEPRARTFFSGLAPSYRRIYVRWVDSAKREETRRRRLAEAIATLRAGRKLGLK